MYSTVDLASWVADTGSTVIPYSGKFLLVQIFAEKRPDSSDHGVTVGVVPESGRKHCITAQGSQLPRRGSTEHRVVRGHCGEYS